MTFRRTKCPENDARLSQHRDALCVMAAHMDEPFATTLIESRRDPTDASLNDIIPAGEPWMGVVCRGADVPHRRRRREPGGRHAVLQRRRTAKSATARRTRFARKGASTSRPARNCLSNDGNVMLTITADTCGRHDTLGGACSAESNTVRYSLDKRHMHSCRDNFLLALARSGIGLTKRDLPSNINFFMNVPVTPDGQADVCRRHFGGGALRGDAGRDGYHRADLQLPAAQQPLQRL